MPSLPASDTTTLTMAQRMVQCAYVELELAKGNSEAAFAITEQLIASADANRSEEQNGLRILKLRGEALLKLERFAEAEAALNAARDRATTQGVLPHQWRLSLLLGNLYQTQKREVEAEEEFALARTLIEKLAQKISEAPLQDAFLKQAIALLPRRSSSSHRNTSQSPGNLTARECEVAALIAQGKSNQVIATTLVVTRRTVETHIGNIMFKLGCTSRTQIAVWAVEKGL